jgi:hypothetical protein
MHPDSKLRRAVDYVGGFVINDNFATIQRLADAFFPAMQDKVEFHAELVARRCSDHEITVYFRQSNKVQNSIQSKRKRERECVCKHW